MNDIITSFIKELDANFIDKCEKLLKIKIEDFIEKYIEDIELLLYDAPLRVPKYKSIDEKIIRLRSSIYKKVTTSCMDKVDDEVANSRIVYDQIESKGADINTFIKIYNASTPELYKEKILSYFQEWKKDKENLLSDFLYLEWLHHKTLRAIFILDIYTLFYIYINEQAKLNSIEIYKIPTIFSSFDIDTTNTHSLFTQDEIERIEQIQSVNELVDVKKELNTSINNFDNLIMQLQENTIKKLTTGNETEAINLATQIEVLRSFKYMNALDIKLFIYLYNYKNMLNDGAIETTINKILSDLGLSSGKKNYDMIEQSITKLSTMKLVGKITSIDGKNKIAISSTMLEFIKVETSTGEKIRLRLGSSVRDMLFNKSVLEYDKDIYSAYSNDTKQISSWLQMKRYSSYIKGNNLELNCNLSIDNFGIFWMSKRLDVKKKRVKAALNEMLSYNHIVESFKISGSSIYIKFLPLDTNDIRILRKNGISEQDLGVNVPGMLLK